MDVTIRNINGGNTVIGDFGRIESHGTDMNAAVAALLEILRQHRDDLADPEAVRTAARGVRDEARSPRPNRERMLALLRDLAAGAGGVTAVAGATEAVTALVQNLS
ncbi:hypothetical protein FB565_004016 [Actinoplanes lutulentus]|uniref:Uncharacterized protein n=1 Tax=Actinoplanes lutulentus TaxID=1287878 RepID=A0A327ZJ83_9ACTN|nr:hypothetical protein [Actinoplanes lutulentus]MBB2944287.1 hypothetical protein [Actinoplanes lutulentus]RAK42480.1 hypothetical protein B0I29_102305 [Actinoplanes lutulentus]